MSKQLFTVTVETTIMVLAEDEAEAEDVARYAAQEEGEWEAAVWTTPMLPVGWRTTSIPFGEGDPANPDKTVGEWLATQTGSAEK